MTTLAISPYDDALARYEPVIGLETHVELGTASKMFCGCATAFGAPPNTHTCPTCLGLPGSLPVVNEAAVRFTVMIGLALHCQIATWCRFARKNYFYPDMPKNFQISQYDEPLCTDGYLDVEVDGHQVRVEVERVHMEEDTGKALHVGGATGRIHGATHSLLDYNRAGVPLVEVVTRPVEAGGRAPEVAKAYVAQLREVLRGLGVSDVRMEQGSLRCDVNTSLRPRGTAPLGTRTETKNVNSLRSVERAVRSEVARQAAVLDRGGRVFQETRHFHEDTGTTTAGRSKEEATDYRYFPEPDLVPLAPSRDWVETIRAALPEPPAVLRQRLAEQLGASEREMAAMGNASVLELVAATLGAGAAAADARNWWLNEGSARANDAGVDPAELGISPAQVARVLALRADGSLSERLARQVVDGVLETGEDPDAVVAARGLRQVSDTGALRVAVDAAIAAAPAVAEKVRAGNEKAVGPLVGAVMKATAGQANAGMVRQLVLERLSAG